MRPRTPHTHTTHAQIVAFRAGASDRKTIVQRALSRVGEKGYNVCKQLSAVRPSTQHGLSALAASVFDVLCLCLLSCTMSMLMQYLLSCTMSMLMQYEEMPSVTHYEHMPSVMHYEHIAHRACHSCSVRPCLMSISCLSHVYLHISPCVLVLSKCSGALETCADEDTHAS